MEIINNVKLFYKKVAWYPGDKSIKASNLDTVVQAYPFPHVLLPQPLSQMIL